MFLSVPMHHNSYPVCELGDTVLFNLDHFNSIGIKYLSHSKEYAIIGLSPVHTDYYTKNGKKFEKETVLNVYDTRDEAVHACEDIKRQLSNMNVLISISGGHEEHCYTDPIEEEIPFT